MATNEDADTNDVKRKRQRSPNHPSINLRDAIEKTGELHGKYGTHPVPIKKACETLGYSTLNSTAMQCVAALSAYGLVDATGSKDERKVAVSAEGDRITRKAPDRDALIKAAAVRPAVHGEVLEHYRKTGLPHDDVLRQYLVWERTDGARFTEDAVDGFITRLRETLGYAGVSVGDTIRDSGSGETPAKNKRTEVAIGSFIQWVSQGVEQFRVPLQVVGIDGDFAFVKESQTGIPMSELELVDPPDAQEGKSPPRNPFFKPVQEVLPKDGTVKEQTTLDEGPVLLQCPEELSEDSVRDLEYWVRGILRKARRRAGMPLEDDA
ncbi:MAG: hypothetical protein KDA75_08330 [Planctomycetaceae bacterium]|nr:hypothetical protein [Planctomycetaceae bacterium]